MILSGNDGDPQTSLFTQDENEDDKGFGLFLFCEEEKEEKSEDDKGFGPSQVVSETDLQYLPWFGFHNMIKNGSTHIFMQ